MSPRHLRPGLAAAALRLTLAALVALVGATAVTGTSTADAAVDRSDWLGTVNAYRAMSGLPPVVAEPAWQAGATAHSCYMIANDISHDETPGRPGYTPEGREAGLHGNVAVSGSVDADARSHIDLWMTGPFHAIGILRPNLRASAYGECEDPNAPRWRSGATLDVLRGIDPAIGRPADPVVFPGNGATVPLYRFVVESPDPLAMCGWSGAAGLPLIAMMPGVVSSASAALEGPGGPIETCVLHAGNATDPTAASILSGDNAVVVVPRAELTDGAYRVSVASDGGSANWGFQVDIGGPLEAPEIAPPQAVPAPNVETTRPTGQPATFHPNAPYRLVDTRIGKGATRLVGGQIARIAVADPGVSAVSANFVAVDAAGAGYLTAFDCSGERPTVSLLGYQPGQAIANQAVVPLGDGHVCLFAKADVDVVIDVNGTYRGGGAGFVPTEPYRVYHTESLGQPLGAGEERPVTIVGAGVPAGAEAVALNVTVVAPAGHGYLQVYPCGAPTASEISTVNYAPADVRPNSVVVPVDGAGRVCLRSTAATNVIVDVTGYFAAEGLTFQALVPVRMFDSRDPRPELNGVTGGARPAAGQVLRVPIAGRRGVPADARAVAVNLTATEATAPTHLTAFPCGALPWASNLNVTPAQVSVANGAAIRLSPEGDLCVYTLQPTHVIVDVTGIWR